MARDPQQQLFVGIGHHVVALDARTGAELWRSKVKNTGFVTVLWDGEALIAASAGEVYRLDPRTGDVLWHNPMPGLGFAVATLASDRQPLALPNAVGAAKAHADASSAAATA
jgi:outer membrane protein assembly factor BamB